MALAGSGAVAIWHDIAPEGRDEFYEWHGREHMPERLSVPGFLRGRRYVALSGEPEYFNLYEVQSPATLTSPGYLARLDAPTPWTLATVTHFRRVARALCDVAATFGSGEGGLVATFRHAVAPPRAQEHRRAASAALQDAAGAPGIAGCHLLVTDEGASATDTAEKRARGTPTEVPPWVILVESWGDDRPFIDWCRAFSSSAAFTHADGAPAWAVYRLQNALAGMPA
jgi:hypothetical protein